MSQIFRKPKLFRKRVKAKNFSKPDLSRAIVPIALDVARCKHLNMVVSVSRGTIVAHKDGKKIIEFMGRSGQTEPDVSPIVVDQNYDITKVVSQKLRSGKNKGEKVSVTVVNNQPKKRYKLFSEALRAEGQVKITPYFAYTKHHSKYED